MPLPKLPEQTEIVRRGDLTAEWRLHNPDLISSENSAEKLLARIKAAQNKVNTAKRGRRKSAA